MTIKHNKAVLIFVKDIVVLARTDWHIYERNSRWLEEVIPCWRKYVTNVPWNGNSFTVDSQVKDCAYTLPLSLCWFFCAYILIISVTSSRARWHLKSPASRLFAKPFILAQFKENIKAPCHWPLCGEFTEPVTRQMLPFYDVTKWTLRTDPRAFDIWESDYSMNTKQRCGQQDITYNFIEIYQYLPSMEAIATHPHVWNGCGQF